MAGRKKASFRDLRPARLGAAVVNQQPFLLAADHGSHRLSNAPLLRRNRAKARQKSPSKRLHDLQIEARRTAPLARSQKFRQQALDRGTLCFTASRLATDMESPPKWHPQ